MTCPLAVMRPKIWLGSALITRLSVTLAVLGCWNCTWASLPTLKVCQLMAARSVLWLITMFEPLWLMLALPALTWPPVGRALTGGAVCAWATLPSKLPIRLASTAATLTPEVGLPLAETVSAAAT